MRYAPNPAMHRYWAASDADLPGSGAELERWALGEIQKAADSGALDMSNTGAVREFLGSLGITPEKGGGRALFNKFMQPGALGGIRPRTTAGAGSPMDTARTAMGDRYGSLALGRFRQPQQAPQLDGGGGFGDWNTWGV